MTTVPNRIVNFIPALPFSQWANYFSLGNTPPKHTTNRTPAPPRPAVTPALDILHLRADLQHELLFAPNLQCMSGDGEVRSVVSSGTENNHKRTTVSFLPSQSTW